MTREGRKCVLCVCDVGVCRSPTAAWVLSNKPYNYNTRSCGTDKWSALIPLTRALIYWADEIVCMKPHHVTEVEAMVPAGTKKIIVLDIEDNYEYRDPRLIKLIKEKYGTIY